MRSGISDIWITPAGGGVVTQLTTDPGRDMEPGGAPDGSWITFSPHRTSADDHIWAIPPGGGTAIELTPSTAWDSKSAWSHDASSIAFTSDRSGNTDIWVIAAPTPVEQETWGRIKHHFFR
jgi:Tol biopolymer transport system component